MQWRPASRIFSSQCGRLLQWRTSSIFSSPSPSPWEEDARVVISGAGPTGLTTALLLAKYGVPSTVLERGTSLPDHPKAHCINQRTMEVFRGLSFPDDGGTGVSLADKVKSAMPPIDQWRSFVYCSGSLLGPSSLLGTVDHFKGDENLDPFRFSPEPVAHVPQHRLVPMLAEMCNRSSLVDLRMGEEVTGFEQTGAYVRVNTNSRTQGTVRGAYLIAADGAHSMIRKSLGISMDGAGTLQHLINIYFTAPTLAKNLVASDRMGMLYFVFGASHVVVLVAHDLGRGEFVAQVPFFPPLQGSHSFGIETCMGIIREIAGGDFAAGDLTSDVVVHDTKPWAMAAAVATRYRAGKVLLAGDAAHVVPPAGAFGMNTGIQDAHNLAWKLAVALKKSKEGAGIFDDTHLLDSYETERRPIAISNMNLSVDNFHEALAVARVIGLDFDTAQSVNALLSSGPMASLAPASVRQQLLGAAMSSGLWMGRAMAKAKRRELKELFDSGKTLRLQYPKEDIGFAYHGRGCFLDVEPQLENAVREAAAPKPRDAPFVEDAQSFVPGKRFPHFYVRLLGGPHGSNRVISSIDVSSLAQSECEFVLFCAASRAASWSARARSSSLGVKILVVALEVPGDAGDLKANADNFCEQTSIRARLIKAEHTPWCSLMARSDDVGVLVRPDGHIYWVGNASQLQELKSKF